MIILCAVGSPMVEAVLCVSFSVFGWELDFIWHLTFFYSLEVVFLLRWMLYKLVLVMWTSDGALGVQVKLRSTVPAELSLGAELDVTAHPARSLQPGRWSRWQGGGRHLWDGLHKKRGELEPPSPSSHREQMGREEEAWEPFVASGAGSSWCTRLRRDEPVWKSPHRRATPRLCTTVLHRPVFWRENTKAQRKEKSQPLDFVGVCNTGWFFKKKAFLWLCARILFLSVHCQMQDKDVREGHSRWM